MRIWLDADSLPLKLRSFVVRRAASYSIKVIFVANREVGVEPQDCDVARRENVAAQAERNNAIAREKLLINKNERGKPAEGDVPRDKTQGNAPREKLLINKNDETSTAGAANKSSETSDAKKSVGYEMIVCDKSPEAADDYIAANAKAFDMVITRDIPLAARLVRNGVCVLNDRGVSYTKESVEKKLRDRNYNLMLAEIGFGGRAKKSYGNKEFDAFAHCFERELMRLVRDETHSRLLT